MIFADMEWDSSRIDSPGPMSSSASRQLDVRGPPKSTLSPCAARDALVGDTYTGRDPRSVGAWRSLAAHLAGGQGVGGSNPLAPTIPTSNPGIGVPSTGCDSAPDELSPSGHGPTACSLQ